MLVSRVMQFRGLATSLRSEISREGSDIKSGILKILDAPAAVGIQRTGWETIIQSKAGTVRRKSNSNTTLRGKPQGQGTSLDSYSEFAVGSTQLRYIELYAIIAT